MSPRPVYLPQAFFWQKDEEAIGRIHTFFPSVYGIENALSGALMNAEPECPFLHSSRYCFKMPRSSFLSAHLTYHSTERLDKNRVYAIVYLSLTILHKGGGK